MKFLYNDREAAAEEKEDGDGTYGLRNYYEYGAFGEFREKEEETENRFGYNGEIFDPIGGQFI